jgi:hypothetical protein
VSDLILERWSVNVGQGRKPKPEALARCTLELGRGNTHLPGRQKTMTMTDRQSSFRGGILLPDTLYRNMNMYIFLIFTAGMLCLTVKMGTHENIWISFSPSPYF